jgi:integrase
LSQLERTQLLVQLSADVRAQRRDLPDLVFFMLATGVRIGEALGVMWSEVDLEAGTVEISSTMIRVKGEGLLRKETKTRSGERPWSCRGVPPRCCGGGS